MEPLILLLNVIAGLAGQRLNEGTAEKIKLVADLIAAGRAAGAEVRTLVAEIEQMVAEGRDPTPEEFESVRRRRAELSAQLRGEVEDLTS